MIVTCTGVDIHTPLAELLALARDFPAAEWGVLWRSGELGRKAPRYPGPDDLRRIASHLQAHGLRAALHLCGRQVDAFFASAQQGTCPDELAALLPAFGRIQLNGRLGADHAALIPTLAAMLQRHTGPTGPARLIVQWNRHNHGFWAALADPTAVDGLVDASGGRGLLPAHWPARAELPCVCVGYAGGLSAQALPSQWSLLQAAAGGLPDWIDAETTVRDEADHFSLARCHAWLAAAARLAGAAGLP